MSSTQITISQAVEFLTLPLLIVCTPNKVVTLQSLLLTSLSSQFSQKRSLGQRLTITISAGSVAPRALYPSCTAAEISWASWFRALGGFEFDLIIEEGSIFARFNGIKKTIWAQPIVDASRAPTMAEFLLSSPEEDMEADELFACISKASIASPTPTRGAFPPFITGSSSVYSRPSSRSSDSSLESASSSRSSSSLSSISSLSDVYTPITALSPSVSTKKHVAFTPSSVPTIRAPVPPMLKSVSQDAILIVDEDDLEDTEVKVVVDTSKKEVSKYMYEGGVSTVLTGGVMLGSAKPKNTPSSSSTASLTRPPVKMMTAKPQHTRWPSASGANVLQWRRC